MGKTAAGAVWLNPSRLSPYDYWQYWRNAEDADVGRFLKLFTDVPMDEIARLEKLQGSEINDAKIVLANEATTLCHGAAAARTAAETARRTFIEGGLGQDLPVIEIARAELEAGIPAYELLRRTGLAASNGEARRLIKGGGARLNDAVIEDENRKITTAVRSRLAESSGVKSCFLFGQEEARGGARRSTAPAATLMGFRHRSAAAPSHSPRGKGLIECAHSLVAAVGTWAVARPRRRRCPG